MAKVFKFDRQKQIHDSYNSRLKEIKVEMAEHAEVIRGYCFDLAMLKVWKDWHDSIEEGTVVEFKDQMFVESGDENVVELMRLCIEMEEFAAQSLTVESQDDDEPSPDDLRKQFTPIKGEKGSE